MSADSPKKMVLVAATIALVCSILVSSAAVLLKPRQDRNRELEKKKNVLICAGLYSKGQNIEEEFKKVTPILVDLKTGKYTEKFDPVQFQKNIKKYMSSKDNVIKLPAGEAISGISKLPRQTVAYIVKKNGKTEQVILPVSGKGLWSTVYGFISIASDGISINGITFYEHGETPGLGGEIENPRWTSIWKGKKAYDNSGQLRIEIIKGTVQKGKDDSIYKVDGLSGATLTSRGVSDFVRFWLDKNGFRPLLKNISAGGTSNE